MMNVAQFEGLVLNSKKVELKWPKVSFFEAEHICEGMYPCPKKTPDTTEFTHHIDNQQLASFIEMATCMKNFVCHLSHHTEPLQTMLKQDILLHCYEMANSNKSLTDTETRYADIEREPLVIIFACQGFNTYAH